LINLIGPFSSLSTTDAVVAALKEFVNVHRLNEIFTGFRDLPNRERVEPVMFTLLERFPDADFGSPGPPIHELEAMSTVLMANRILNSDLTAIERLAWLNILRVSAEHSGASQLAKDSAHRFVQYQTKRGNA
jgi:hypothetical protein